MHSAQVYCLCINGDCSSCCSDGGFREAPALYARSSSSTAPAKHASNASNHVRLDAGENANPYPVNGLSYRAMPERIPVPDTALMTSPVHLVSSSNVARPRKELVLPSDSNGNGLSSSLTCIRIKPDSDGKFGFNVRVSLAREEICHTKCSAKIRECVYSMFSSVVEPVTSFTEMMCVCC